MDFFIDLGLFAGLIVFIMAFMGIITTKIAEAIGGKKGHDALNETFSSKKGWRLVGGKRK